MRKNILQIVIFAFVAMFGVGLCSITSTFADEEANNTGATSISISPTSNSVKISSESEYVESFEVTNEGERSVDIEVYAAPYSYVYSESDDIYQRSFTNENSYTQIVRWITFKDNGGSWVEKPTFTIKPKETLTVEYRISTPNNIPAGGQYAVLFAHTLNSVASTNGIKTEASPGILLYGRSTEGESITKAEIYESKIEDEIDQSTGETNIFHATSKVKNSGNVDFNATGTLTVSPILGGASYKTENDGVKASVIPESELIVEDEWKDAPDFGIYKVSWSIAAGGETQTVEKIIFVNPLPFIILFIILLTIVIVWIIIKNKKRKERDARLAV